MYGNDCPCCAVLRDDESTTVTQAPRNSNRSWVSEVNRVPEAPGTSTHSLSSLPLDTGEAGASDTIWWLGGSHRLSLRSLLSTRRRQGHSGVEAVAGAVDPSEVKESGPGDVGEKRCS